MFGDDTLMRSWLTRVLELEGFVPGDISYVFCTDDYLHTLNRQFLSHDEYTDILTFPTAKNSKAISGEIYISADRVHENAATFKVKPNHELLRVMVHGMLHLMGYNDATAAEKSVMRAKEDYYINLHP
ncbi:MAG: rRNA maturation RNase YbeY [bacterium]